MTAAADRLAAALANRYVLERELGTGGMATVYLAHDARHDRSVALKVLKSELAAVLGPDRFVQEIKTTAGLQHPHILPLFDSGTAGGFLYYVMPYVQGETLRAKLDRETQLGVDEAVRIAREVADALDYAHRHGVIHRDIKPENILLHDGRPLVADFGIALAVSAAAGGRMTETGLSLGTPHYMSPEQATAEKEITARSDVYSLGCVLYEMLTGNPPHTGAVVQQIIMKIVTEPAEAVTKYRRAVPPNVAAAVAKALEKLPADRFETAREFAAALGNPSFGAGSAASGSGAPRRPARTIGRDLALVGVTAAVVMAGAWASRPRPAIAPLTGFFRVDLPDSVTLSPVGGVSVSRDGERLAFGCIKGAVQAICVRQMSDTAVALVRGTEGARYARFSPDGAWLVFQSGGYLRKVPFWGGKSTAVIESERAFGNPSWGDGDVILYEHPVSSLGQSPLAIWSVRADGTDARAVTVPSDTGRIWAFIHPFLLPGSQYALVAMLTGVRVADSAPIGVLSLADGTIQMTGVNGVSPRYIAPGYLLFSRGGDGLWMVPFSPSTRRITGSPIAVHDGVRSGGLFERDFGVSETAGTLAYVSSSVGEQQVMVVVDASGKETPLGPARMYKEPRVSPDGRRVVVRIGSGPNEGDLWMHDLAAGTTTPFTRDGQSLRGEWSRDGRTVIYVNRPLAPTQYVLAQRWDGSAGPDTLARGDKPFSFYEIALGKSGSYSVVRRGGSTRGELLIAPTDSLQAAAPLSRSAAGEVSPRVSPSGRLVTYSSLESGQNEVYVREIPGPGAVVQVSVDGGTEPVWSGDGSTLYYRGPRRMMAARIAEGRALSVVKRDSLFVDTYRRYYQHAAYDVFPDGRGFLMTRDPGGAKSQLFVLLNWTPGSPGGRGRP